MVRQEQRQIKAFLARASLPTNYPEFYGEEGMGLSWPQFETITDNLAFNDLFAGFCYKNNRPMDYMLGMIAEDFVSLCFDALRQFMHVAMYSFLMSHAHNDVRKEVFTCFI